MIEAGKYYTGKFVAFDVVQFGNSMAMQFTIDIPGEGQKETTNWLGKNSEWIKDQLVKFGCDPVKLSGEGWRGHIESVMAGKAITAKAEEYKGKVNLKGLYVPSEGGAKRVELDKSPFSMGGDDRVIDDDSVPF